MSSETANAVVTHKDVNGYEDFCSYLDSLNDSSQKTILYFSGDRQRNGQSWCSDCVEAEPIVNSYLEQVKDNVTFVHVSVGTRDYWKDVANPFRTDPRTRLMVIPTLIRWKGVQRLEGSQCNNKELLDMLFSDEDD